MSSIPTCCTSGHIHTGSPNGGFELLHGTSTYVSRPADGSKSKTAVILTDVFGPASVNVQLHADKWAERGFYVLVPDIFQGDAIPVEQMYVMAPKKGQDGGLLSKAKSGLAMASMVPWFWTHRESVTKPIVDQFIQGVRGDPETGKIVTIGFCFGGRYAILAGRRTEQSPVDACIAYHPSLVSIPADFVSLDAPTYVGLGALDMLIPENKVPAMRQALIKELGEDKVRASVFPDMIHGFVMRGDSGDKEEREAMERATEEGIQWAERWVTGV